jgi:hypothetical protein
LDYSAYVRTLLSVFVGLGLGQLVQPLHRLARFEGTVRWDWLPLGWAFFAFVMVVQTWWAYFDILQSALWLNLFAFLLPISVFVTLYMICASALPDVSKAPADGVVDLAAFHLRQRRYFFGLWALFLSLALIVSLLVRGSFALLEDGFRVLGVALAIGLVTSSRRAVHVALTILSFVAFSIYITRFSLRIA